MPSLRRRLRSITVLAAASLLGGCSTVGYYWQGMVGHLEILSSAQTLETMAANGKSLSPEIAAKLERARAIRSFASVELGLPDNASYRSYADLGRRYVLWNVF